MAKRALIVDDSKTAQLRLRKMLDRFDIEIDTANSAEEALGYLSYRQPAVIFMDHHMEGMSGLSALKIIKSNPATALIPVVMYTSEQGDVYVGQARALGALDILSKEVVQPANIEKLLTGLGIPLVVKEPKPQADSAPKPEAVNDRPLAAEPPVLQRPATALPPASLPYQGPDRRAASPYVAATDLNKIQAQVGKLFELHIAKVRQEMADNTKFLLRRLSKEIQERAPKPGPEVKAEMRLPTGGEPLGDAVAPSPAQAADASKAPTYGVLFPVLVFVALAFMAYQLFAFHEGQKRSQAQFQHLVTATDKQGALVTRVLEQLAAAHPAEAQGADARVLLDALSWATNVNPLVPFGEKALNDPRIYTLGELLNLLKAANFKGTVFIDVHAGNFCAVRTASGSWVLPEPDDNLEACVFMADQTGSTTLNDQVSVGFLNYLHSAPALAAGAIQVELSYVGFDSPRVSYPGATSATSAGQWNQAASQNNRLVFSFSPES
jgi:CheY-like chemotaxis protein